LQIITPTKRRLHQKRDLCRFPKPDPQKYRRNATFSGERRKKPARCTDIYMSCTNSKAEDSCHHLVENREICPWISKIRAAKNPVDCGRILVIARFAWAVTHPHM